MNEAAARDLVNLKSVSKSGRRGALLGDVTIGVREGERVGVVGGNGTGKSTLLRLVAGQDEPDGGVLTRRRGLGVALLGQRDALGEQGTVGEAVVGGRAQHEWAGDAAFREMLGGLLGSGGVERFAAGMETPIAGLSGGERRRVALAALLADDRELVLLDEPTNHLDVEGIEWLAGHLRARRRGAVVVVTHDRWLLNEVCTATWEVTEGTARRFEGGYEMFLVARAERARGEAARDARRRALLRKELAWLARGPKARAGKSKSRVAAAAALIEQEPAVRERVELLRFGSARLGERVLDAEGVSLQYDGRVVLREVTWRLGPGKRVALVGANGSGKTSLLRMLAGELEPSAGRVQRGATVRVGYLSQEAGDLPEELRVREALEEVRQVATVSDGRELTVGGLCERFGFGGARERTPVAELSGGERRRLGLMRLLMGEPNVLLLDEPTNDLDVETLRAVEDLLDGWPGTLVVVSHDRWFVERVCSDVYAIGPGGVLVHVPGGVEQYLAEQKRALSAFAAARQPPLAGPAPASLPPRPSTESPSPATALPRGAQIRAARKEVERSERRLQRLERALEKLAERRGTLQEEMAAHATDHERLTRLQADLELVEGERERAEAEWIETSEALERG